MERKFGDRLTVIGVHSAKFAGERDEGSLREAVLRFGITHPVVNDSAFQIWNAFGISGWPTLVLIGTDGKIVKRYSGEGHLDELLTDIGLRLAPADPPASPAAAPAALPIALEKDREKPAALRFPAKVLWVAVSGKPYLFVADTGHNQVVGLQLIAPNLGRVRWRIGAVDGQPGAADGAFSEARFDHPQGIAWDEGQLFIADTGNHLLRRVDLRGGRVATEAGTGRPGERRLTAEAPALTTALSSPWDVALYPSHGQVVLAMAGTHQLWTYDRQTRKLTVLAGNGNESIDDGVFPQNSLSQPSGLSVASGKLYFVDAETSSLRVLQGDAVVTLIGTGLFDFGFRDGTPGRALMQHPQGCFATKSGVYVADTYNHAIRRFDLATGKLETVAGVGRPGPGGDGPLAGSTFDEPNAISGPPGEPPYLYVADTNNHAIRVLDLKAHEVTRLMIEEADTREVATARQIASDLPQLSSFPPVELEAGKRVTLRLDREGGWKVNTEAPSWIALFGGDGKDFHFQRELTRTELTRGRAQFSGLTEHTVYRLQGTVYFCESTRNALCRIRSFDQSFSLSPSATLSELVFPLR